jgi:hypothetical protein
MNAPYAHRAHDRELVTLFVLIEVRDDVAGVRIRLAGLGRPGSEEYGAGEKQVE